MINDKGVHMYDRKIRCKFMTVLVLVIICMPFKALSQDVPAYSLDELVRMALKFSPQIKEQQQEVEIAKTRLEEAEGYQWPQLELITLFGPAPNARGDQVASDFRNDRVEGLGVFGSADVKVIQPLYTFGKITEAKKAASHGISVEKSRVRQKSTDVALEIKQYYYGHLAALEGEKLIDEIQGYLDSTMKRTKRLIEAGSESATELDLHKLETYQGLLAKSREEVKKNLALSKSALRTFTGLGQDAGFTLKDETLEPVDVVVEELGFYSAKSRELRPEFTQLREGLKAKEALINMTETDYYPNIFAAAFYSYSDATGRDRVTNPWIYDFFRHSAGGAALGLKWSADFGITDSHVRRARADYIKLERLREFAEIGIPLQVEKSYRELIEAKEDIEATGKAFRAARKWMIGAVMNYDMGIGEAKDAADAIAAYGKMKEEYIRSVYNFNMGHANVLQASGLSGEEIPSEEGN
ncbi:MAG: TolC family protein [Nitrospiraceae bacterium]|nr:MAG: TolC family protein [Nitrospiraceae bacterium]